MAVVGSAYIVVNAITTGFKDDIDDIINNLNSRFAKAGASFGKSFSKSTRSGFSGAQKEAVDTYNRINDLIKASYKLQGALGLIIPAIGATASGLAVMAFQAAAAVPSFIVLVGAISAAVQGMVAFKLAFSGVGKAVGAITKPGSGIDRMPQLLQAQGDAEDRLTNATRRLKKANDALTDSYEQARRELEKLRYDSEDAVNSEKRAVIELEKAREQLLRVQDLPPNTRARREAELAFREADLNLRKARSSVNDLNTDLNKATKNGELNRDQTIANSQTVLSAIEEQSDAQKDFNKAQDAKRIADKNLKDAEQGKGSGGQDPFAGLNKFQIEFAKFIAGLKPKIDKLKLSVSQGLLPALEDAITIVVTRLFPTIDAKLKETGIALGKASTDFAKGITTPDAIKNIAKNMDTNNYVLENTGTIIANLATLLSALLAAADPVIRKFTDWITALTGGWSESAQNNISGLTDMFNRSGEIAANFGDIIGNIAGAFVNIGKAIAGSGGPGDSMTGWLENLSQRFEDFTAKHLASGKLQEYFQTAFDGFKEILKIVGNIVAAILRAGGDESFEGSARRVGEGVSAILDKMPELIEGGAAFAEFVADFLEMSAEFIESGSIQTFFGIVSKAIDIVVGFLQLPLVGEIFKMMAMIHAARAAFGVLGLAAKTTGLFIKGSMILSTENIKKAKGAFDTLALTGMYAMDSVKKGFTTVKSVGKQAFDGLRTAATAAAGGIKAAGSAIANSTAMTKLAGAATKVWTGIQAAFNAVMALNPIVLIAIAVAALIAALVLLYFKVEGFREVVDAVFGFVLGIIQGLWNWIRDNWPLLLAILLGPFGLLIYGVVKNWDRIVEFVKAIPERLRNIGSTIWTWITDRFTAMRETLAERVSALVSFVTGLPARIRRAASGLWDGIGDAFKNMINRVISWWNNFRLELRVPKNRVTDFLGLGGLGFTLDTPDIKPLAMGGVVMPTPGGILARIGEAGRPERVEPLDPDGLSKRDKAMIKMMTGGAAGGVTINVSPSPGMDEVELASLISRQLAFQLRAGSI